MSKKIQITRTIELDEVPNEILLMLDESHNLFNLCIDNYFKQLKKEVDENKNHTKFLKLLEEFRIKLAKADNILEDSNNIMIGYINILTETQTPAEPESTQHQENPNMSPEFVEMMKENMAKQIAAMENHKG